MTGTQLATFTTLVVTAVLMIVLLIIAGPRLARMLFRHRFDTIRDDCMDAILGGQLPPDAPTVQEFMQLVDDAISECSQLTLARLLSLHLALAQSGVDLDGDTSLPGIAELEPDQRQLLEGLDLRAQAAFISYLTWGSPLGWALVPFLQIASRLPDKKVLAREAMQNTPMGRRPTTLQHLTGH